jgi:hypothetical protein
VSSQRIIVSNLRASSERLHCAMNLLKVISVLTCLNNKHISFVFLVEKIYENLLNSSSSSLDKH